MRIPADGRGRATEDSRIVQISRKKSKGIPTMKHHTWSNRGPSDEAGALSPDQRNRPQSRRYAPKRYSFLEDACMARAMYRL
ncbi:hypothetical protein BZL29_0307 [Mycobacterium kansasii]|uniref:Uncharacterized protein n=3 Tax=Mycobacterium kansasii TaxID=1768 RepID=A0A1V3XY26_MYCKA|nr:hypothetical protein BZL29_0307 [Mycobacterium kansasii]